MERKNLRRSIIIVMITVLMLAAQGCGNAGEQNDSDTPSSKANAGGKLTGKEKSAVNAYESLVINGYDLPKDSYVIEKRGGKAYILMPLDTVSYSFSIPYSTSTYPDISTDNGQISISWTNNNEAIVKIDMVEGSREAYVNESNEPIDMGIAPKAINDKLHIPINLLVDVLQMKETYDQTLGVTVLSNKDDFLKDLLVGSWSNTHTDLFNSFADASGLQSLSSYVMAYRFEKNGTYRLLMAGAGGFEDEVLQCSGKYKILGNTIVFYNIRETLSKGTPLKTVHKNKKVENPSYEFISMIMRLISGASGFIRIRFG
ncbi:MAG: copper amine oxidase N-terminal domain-containing protein [Clostridia bacterium]|nr:copper amine oxidase N-terminal domain-containing protein [Clostridia bacterium]